MRNNNVGRILSGKNGFNNFKDVKDRSIFLGQTPTLLKAVVIEVITDPSLIEEDSLKFLPVNSLLARITTNDEGASLEPNTILLPLFSSHMMLPVKPGEMVYSIFEDIRDNGPRLGYWISRIPNLWTVEDANYTHNDRKFDELNDPANLKNLSNRSFLNEKAPGPDFINGGGGHSNRTLSVDKDTNVQNPFEQIKSESKSYSLHTQEPVPRWKKRPGEYVLQGSNNTMISLGEDRSGGLVNEEDSRVSAGAIDIVAGRGRFLPDENETPELTAPRIIINTRGELETDKAPYRRGLNRKDNQNEGNPDFENDASRILVSMQTEADKKFGLNLNTQGSLSLPEINDKSGTNNRSFVLGKSDHIRLIARKNSDKNINGTILLIREGGENQDLGYFFIDDFGRIQIESNKIYLGRSVDEKEPYILWSKFFETRNQLQNEIDILENKVKELSNIVQSAFQNAIGNLGAPIPSLLAAAPQIKLTSESMSQQLTDPRQAAIDASDKPSQSSKIYGE